VATRSAVGLKRPGERTIKQAAVKEGLVDLTSPGAVTSVARPARDRDLLRDLEAEAQRLGRLAEEPLPVVRTGELIEAEVAADDRERLGILGQAFPLECLMREPAADLVSRQCVNRPEPVLVLPGTCPEEDSLGGQ
jgi:hypothetical protein